MSDVINLRKNINNLTLDELKKLRSAYKKAMKISDNRGFVHFAGFHGYPNWQCWHGPQSKDGWPGVRLFFPWHRAYLYSFERALQDLEPGVTIPWWDWRSEGQIQSQNSIPKAFSDETTGPSKEGIQKELLKPFYDITKSKDPKKIQELLSNMLKNSKQKEIARKILQAFTDKLPTIIKNEFNKNFNLLFNQKMIQKGILGACSYFLLSQKKTLDEVLSTFAETPNGIEPNPLYSFHMKFPERNIDRHTRRFPGKSLGVPLSLPTPSAIQDILNIGDNHFDEFSDAIEEIHGLIHVWTGGEIKQNTQRVSGDMSSVAFAAYDPIFWSHHCMIDRLWWMWQKKNGIDEIPKHYRKMALEPFGMTVEEVLDVYDLGYDYAGTETTVNGNWSHVNG